MEASSDQNDSKKDGTCYFLRQELCGVVGEKTILMLKLEELQRELARLREEKASGGPGGAAGDAGATMSQCRMLERENKMLRAQLIHDVDDTRQLRQNRQKLHTSPSSVPQAEPGIDSVRLPSEELRRAVRVVYGPGRIVLDDGATVTIEYAHDYIIVRGPQPNRNSFMALLLHAVLKHMERAPQQEKGDGGKERHGLGGSRAVSPSTTGVGAPREEDDGGPPRHVLRRAIDMEKMEREKAQMALHDAEHECALQQAAWNVERAHYMEEKRRLEGRIRRLEGELGRRSDSLGIALRRLEERDPQGRGTGDERHADDVVAAASPQRGGGLIHPCGRRQPPERHGASSAPGETSERQAERNDEATNSAGDNSHVGGSSLACRTSEETMTALEREVELLRDEKDRLSRRLQLSAGVVDEQRTRLQNVEAAAAHLFRSVLSSSEVASMVLKGAAAAPRSFIFSPRCGGVDAHGLRALVHSLSASGAAASPVERRLAELATLLEAEHGALKASLDFAVHERDAALQARREEALLDRPHDAAVAVAPRETTDVDGRGANASRATTLEEENVKLRTELRRCFEDMRHLAHTIERSQAAYHEAQEKLRASDRRLREKEETARRVGHRQEYALMAALERERSLELQLRRLQEQNPLGAMHHLNAATAHPETRRGTFAHLVSTPSRKSGAASGLTPDDSQNNCMPHHPHHTENRGGGFIDRSGDLHSKPSTAPTPVRGTGEAAPLSPPMGLRREDFEEALHAIYP